MNPMNPTSSIDQFSAKGVESQSKMFGDSLKLYRMAMTVFSKAMSDLNFNGRSRLDAMNWWVSRDEGLLQPEELSSWVARYHATALSVDAGLAQKLGRIQIGSLEGGRKFTVADVRNPEQTLSLLREAAGVFDDSVEGPLLANTAEVRIARARTSQMLQAASIEISNSVTQFLGQRQSRTVSNPVGPTPIRTPGM